MARGGVGAIPLTLRVDRQIKILDYASCTTICSIIVRPCHAGLCLCSRDHRVSTFKACRPDFLSRLPSGSLSSSLALTPRLGILAIGSIMLACFIIASSYSRQEAIGMSEALNLFLFLFPSSLFAFLAHLLSVSPSFSLNFNRR